MIEKEIEKWTNRIEPIIDKIEVIDPKGEEMLRNIKAYVKDSKHFKEKGDLVRSFECIIWSWAIFEICRDLGIFKVNL